ncbi:hypothetical protein BJD12_11270 [Xanthomonas vesicatoria ATCC 35937]|uniref:Uncharacterized protein n=1 Tax=Xanthomonas vesicatoria ATCC 35937 TaxID=925775 RepID=F0BGV2_9XANT|nr:hypothetical protein [Xanthomonas vesicatoria]APP75726.1 hypothetical protein BJD12_11270 [Xanthomonas vesicatoria ATCC 35937]EGD08297.1 hypothetical protein XVE_3479 [Xanthomonas vesicatoria ATCC 35937]KTF30920.1 hypothetical protein LMG920_17925 [Xanthomonas vesicatoria]MCC8596887.1 hypothetical protein [Xanthomonas vesicatoria]MCC8605085.1 hypothetical protein [Xanthomonas vesicatoria]
MSGSTQHPANAQLHALAQVHQLGQIDRVQYRARRRNVLDAARQAQGATLRNPQLRPLDDRSSPPLQRERFSQYRKRATAIVVTVTAVALMLLIFHKCTPGFDRRSVRGERNHADFHAGMHPDACTARHVGHARQRKFSGVSDVCV